MDSHDRTAAGAAVTGLILETFRLNGRLLSAGDALCRDLGLTSARWQVMGAIDAAPLPVAHIARTMGLTRQAVQRVTNDLAAEGFVTFQDNPHHRRAKQVALSARGRSALNLITARQIEWSNRLAATLAAETLATATAVMATLCQRLETGLETDPAAAAQP